MEVPLSQRRRLVCLVVVLPLLLSVSCTGESDDTKASGSSTSASAGKTTTPESTPTSAGASPTDEQAPEPNFPADTSDDRADAELV